MNRFLGLYKASNKFSEDSENHSEIDNSLSEECNRQSEARICRSEVCNRESEACIRLSEDRIRHSEARIRAFFFLRMPYFAGESAKIDKMNKIYAL